MSGQRSTASAPPYSAWPGACSLQAAQAPVPAHIAHAPSCHKGVSSHSSSASGRSPLLKTPPRAVCVALMLRHHATPSLEPVKMAAAVLSGPSAGSPAGAPGGPGGLSLVGSGPRLRLLLLESISGLLQPRTGSPVAPVHPPIQWAPHLPGLMCLLRLHGTAGGAQVSPWLAWSPWEGW